MTTEIAPAPQSIAKLTPSLTEEGGYAVIRIPVDQVQSLKVALAPCPCAAPKSNATAGIRERLRAALGQIGGKK